MTSNTAGNKTKYARQRKKVQTPHVPIKGLRIAAGMTIEALIKEIKVVSGLEYTKGAISAVEIGLRGASPDLLAALERVYKLDPGLITTSYEPHQRRGTESAA